MMRTPLTDLTNDELVVRVRKELSSLCNSSCSIPKRWQMTIPVGFNRDSDVLFGEMLSRFCRLTRVNEAEQCGKASANA